MTKKPRSRPYLSERGGQPAHALGDRGLRKRRISEHDRVGRLAGHDNRIDADVVPARLALECVGVDRLGKAQDGVQPPGEALDPRGREVALDGGQQRVAAGATPCIAPTGVRS